MTGRAGPRIALVSAILTLVAGVVGFIVAIVLNVFVFDEFDAYGELPIPGSGSLHLPAGEVTISYHTAVPGGVDGGFPVPPPELGIRQRGGPFVAGIAALVFALSWWVRSGRRRDPLERR